MAVVTASKLKNQVPAREAARQAYCRHGGFGAGVDHTHLLHAW